MLPAQIRTELLRHYRGPGPTSLLLRFAQDDALVYWNDLERPA